MRDHNAFSRAIDSIASQAEAERKAELVLERRRNLGAKVRAVIASFLWVALIATSFYYHDELQQFATKYVFANSAASKSPLDIVDGSTNGRVRGTITALQEQAARRDAVLAETAK